jgi:von Willebrand factor type A domain
MSFRRGSIAVLVVLLLIGTRLLAQTDPCLHGSLSVNILVPQSTTAPALTADDLRAKLDKKPVKIFSVLPDEPPHRIVVLLDSSGSVLSHPEVWRAYLAIAKNLVTNPPEGTSAQLAVFGDRIDMVITATNDRAKLDSQFKSLEAGWGFFKKPRATALWDALKHASDGFGSPRQGDVLYVLTDGDDNTSRFKFDDVENDFRSKPIKLLLISVRAPDQPSVQAKKLKKLQDLALETGGATADLSDKLKLESLSQSIARPYRLEIELPAQLKNTENSTVTLRGKTIEGTDVNYSGRLVACSSSTTENPAH